MRYLLQQIDLQSLVEHILSVDFDTLPLWLCSGSKTSKYKLGTNEPSAFSCQYVKLPSIGHDLGGTHLCWASSSFDYLGVWGGDCATRFFTDDWEFLAKYQWFPSPTTTVLLRTLVHTVYLWILISANFCTKKKKLKVRDGMQNHQNTKLATIQCSACMVKRDGSLPHPLATL